MPAGFIRYKVGNEHNPGDPWGRSELVIEPGGGLRLDHYFSRGRPARAWTGRLDAPALAALAAALDLAGFPAVPRTTFSAGATLRVLTVQTVDGGRQHAVIDWHQAASLPGYAEAFDLLDGVIRQLSGGSVNYPSSEPVTVTGISPASCD